MCAFVIKVPSKRRKFIKIIREESAITKELERRNRRLQIWAEIDDEDVIEEVIEEIIPEPEPEPEYKEPEKPVFYQHFTFSNYDQPVQLDLDKVRPPSLPITIVKEEIQKAYDKGITDGHIQAKSVLDREILQYEARIRKIDNITEELSKQQRKSIDDIYKNIVEISMNVAKEIINLEIATNAQIVFAQVEKAVKSLVDEKVFKIEVNPLDFESLRIAKSRLLDNNELTRDVSIISNPIVKRGGCLLHTTAGLIDARIETQLDIMHRALKEALADAVRESAEKMADEIGDKAGRESEFVLPDDMDSDEFPTAQEGEEDVMAEIIKDFSDEDYQQMSLDDIEAEMEREAQREAMRQNYHEEQNETDEQNFEEESSSIEDNEDLDNSTELSDDDLNNLIFG